MKATLSPLYVVALLLLTLTACSKSNVSPDREPLLTAHTWRYSQISRESEDDWFLNMEVQDMTLILYQNYEITFFKDGTYTLHPDGTGIWKLSDDQKTILFDYDRLYSKRAQGIDELTEKSLKINWKADYIDLENQVHTATIRLHLAPVE